DRSWRNQPVGVDGLGLADAMRAINGLGFDSGVPPRIVQDDIAGSRKVQPRAGGAEAEQKDGGIRVALERVDDFLASLGLAGQDMRRDLALTAFFLKQLEHLHKLTEQEDLLTFGQQRLEQLKQSLGLAGNRIVSDQIWVAASLAHAP